MLTGTDMLRVAVLCSRRAPGLDALLRNPAHGRAFHVACIVTSEEAPGDALVIDSGAIPVIAHPLRALLRERGAALRDRAARAEYDAATAQILRQFRVDAVALLGYLYVLTPPMLSAFAGRIINIHDADLTIRRADGRPRWIGLHATRDAIGAGASETRSTVHVVDEVIDGGPILLRSEPYPVAPFVHGAVAAGASDVVKAYAYAHREWMIRSSWGSLVAEALGQLAAGAREVPAMAVAR